MNGIVYDSFKEAARQLGFVDDESDEFDKCLSEASQYQMPSQLRQLFASICLYCNSQEINLSGLLNKYINNLWEDYEHQQQQAIGEDQELSDDDLEIIVAKTLQDIVKHLISHGTKLSDFGLLPPNYALLNLIDQNNQVNNNLVMQEELNYDQDEIDELLEHENDLNPGQRNIYDTIIDTVNSIDDDLDNSVFFVDGPGGYGKTFLFNMILAKVRSMGDVAIAVASSGIAALLLNGGRTAHSRFKIPLTLTETSTLNINYDSDLAKLIRNTTLIIWDEAPMAHKHIFEAVDRTFRDLTGENNKPFGGIIFVMGGDFRQILPVVIRGTRAHITDACIKSSTLWKNVCIMQLTENMRIQQHDEEQQDFVKYLLKIGEGKEAIYEEDIVKLYDDMVLDGDDIESLISKVFTNLDANFNDQSNYIDYIKNRAILTTKNENVDDINEKIINIFPGRAQEFLSADSVRDSDSVHENLYPTEFLNTITPSGTPPHRLILKVGVPIILLRNLSPKEGLCNGTRLIVKGLQSQVIDAEICTNSHVGKRVYIPRIRIEPSDADLPFQLIRRQFPIRLAFAMTINKAQGQTIKYVGLDLRNPVFTHGQLYVALSRVQSKNNISILVNDHDHKEDGIFTKNIVYREVFQ